MKSFKYYGFCVIAFVTLLLSAQGCSDEKDPAAPDNPKQTITIPAGEDTSPVIEEAGGTTTLTFTATADWTVEVGAVTRAVDWVSVHPTKGPAGEATLTITTRPNDTYDERNAAITLTCGGQRTTLTVTQKQQDALLVSSNKVELDAAGGTFTVSLQANVEVRAEIEPGIGWLKTDAASTRAMTDTALSFHADENVSKEARQATITLTGGEGLTEQVAVYQAGSGPMLVLSQWDYLVGSGGETIRVELRSNTDYEVQMPAVDWLTESTTRSISAYTHYFTVKPNDTYDNREAQIVFTSKEENISDTLTVTQLQLNALVLARDEYTVFGEADTLSFAILANVDIKAESDVDWITPLPATRALEEHTLDFRIDALPDSTERTGIITLTGGENIRHDIKVRQMYKEPKLVDVKYRTAYEWYEAEYNLSLRYAAIVYRDRYYDNGEMFTDKFMDISHIAYLSIACGMESGAYDMPFGYQFVRNKSTVEANDSVFVTHSSLVVPNLNSVVVNHESYLNPQETVPGHWEEYQVSKLYGEGLNTLGAEGITDEWERCDLPTGWYFWGTIIGNKSYNVAYEGLEGDVPRIAYYSYDKMMHDQFLVIDGRRIDFLKYFPYARDIQTNIKEVDIDIPAKVITCEGSFQFMGRTFYSSYTDTIYEQKYDPQEVYYFGSSTEPYGEWEDRNWMFSKYEQNSVADLVSPSSFTIEANRRPIVSTDNDWITIESITQGGKVPGSPRGMDLYEWTITWRPAYNFTGNERIGHIYLKDNQGEVKRTAEIRQQGTLPHILMGKVDVKGTFNLWGYGDGEISVGRNCEGILTYHKTNETGLIPAVAGIDTSGWSGLSWHESGSDIVFQITPNSSSTPRTAVIHLRFDTLPYNYDIVMTQDGQPSE